MFGLNKKYDIPFVIGAGIIVIFAYNVGQKKTNETKHDLNNDKHYELANRRVHHGGKLRKTKKYKNIRI